MINIGNSVGMGNANFNGQSSASGPSTGMNFDLNIGGAAQPTLMLVNLADAGYDGRSPVIIDGVTSNGRFSRVLGRKNSTRPTVVKNFKFGDKVFNFTLAPGETRTL